MNSNCRCGSRVARAWLRTMTGHADVAFRPLDICLGRFSCRRRLGSLLSFLFAYRSPASKACGAHLVPLHLFETEQGLGAAHPSMAEGASGFVVALLGGCCSQPSENSFLWCASSALGVGGLLLWPALFGFPVESGLGMYVKEQEAPGGFSCWVGIRHFRWGCC